MRVRSLLVLLLVVVALAAGVLAGIAGGATTPGAKGCAAATTVVWAGEEPGGGAAGSVYYRIEFTNLSTATCTVSGYPKVNAVDLKGRRIGAFATHEAGKKARIVTLAPGKSATATLRIVDALNFPADKCKATMAAGLRVGLPGGSGAKIAPLAFETCVRSASPTLSVGIVTPAR